MTRLRCTLARAAAWRAASTHTSTCQRNAAALGAALRQHLPPSLLVSDRKDHRSAKPYANRLLARRLLYLALLTAARAAQQTPLPHTLPIYYGVTAATFSMPCHVYVTVFINTPTSPPSAWYAIAIHRASIPTGILPANVLAQRSARLAAVASNGTHPEEGHRERSPRIIARARCLSAAYSSNIITARSIAFAALSPLKHGIGA